ncbi:hypothetical protein D7V91_10035 [bacterium 1xD42-67]|nr:hypothetical protein D7V91_10035 [bacterium 1xD42-67]
MKRRIFTAVLAAAMVLSLAACGGKNGGASSSDPGGSSGGGSSSSQTDSSQPGASGSAGGSASSSDGFQSGGVALTLNRTDITLNKAGATFQLRYTAEPDTDGTAAFTSSDEKVATVAEDGTVKAVAPGKAVITVTYDGASASANVTCDWKTETDPAPDTSKPSGGSSSNGSSSNGSSSNGSSSGGSSSSSPSDTSVDLLSFYETTLGNHDFSFMMEADDTALSSFFAGLSDLTLAQRVIYLCGMSPSPVGDFALVQVSDAKDVETVKDIFQARIDYMVGDGNGPGGAHYPGPTDMWENQSRIVSNGDYVMLIVHPNCDDIVNEFNALF